MSDTKHTSPSWFREIELELNRAIEKFPTWPDDPIHAAAIVAEECGELQQAVLQNMYEPHKTDLPSPEDEAIQTAAMAIRFLRSLHRYDFRPGSQHEQAKGKP